MHRKFDDSFKIMAVDLRVVKGSVAEVAKELDIDPSLLSKWRRNPRYNGNKVLPDNPKISPEEPLPMAQIHAGKHHVHQPQKPQRLIPAEL